MMAGLHKVISNQRKPGVDGLTVDELELWLKENWQLIREKLLTERYKPWPVRRHPKARRGNAAIGHSFGA